MGKCLFMRKGDTHTVPKKSLNDYTWAEIRAISDAGKASKWFSVGDCKEIVLNGTVGHLTLSNYKTYAFIIGIDHNASVEGANRIHFQLAKTALSSGTDIALCDGACNSVVSTTGYFSMNSSNSNSGGWEYSQMRTVICGTSLSSYSGTVLDVIPTELRSVLKPVTKYTDNTGGGGGSTASYVTATNDYFFLLSEYEFFGSISYSNSNESSKQKQYDYYSAGNSKTKYRHDTTSTAVRWLLRSPYNSNSSHFGFVDTDNKVYAGAAYVSYGFAPAFCV